MEKIILSVEIHNNREFVVWRTEDDTAIATLCNTTKGGYLVNTIRVAAKDMKSMKVIYTFSDISRAICDVEKHIEEEFGKCVFSAAGNRGQNLLLRKRSKRVLFRLI